MADDDVDSLDDGQRWEGGDDDSFPAAGEVKPVTCEVAKTLPLPDLRQHLRSRGKSPAGGRNTLVERLVKALVERGESFPVDPEHDGVGLNEPQRRSSAADSHVMYLFAAGERDAPASPGAPGGRPTGRKSFSSAPAAAPFGTSRDLEDAEAKMAAAHLSGLPSAPAAPFSTNAAVRLPPRSSLPSAPPVAAADADSGALEDAVSVVAKMSLPELREALRARGLNPAGGHEALTGRLCDYLRGAPPDAPPFVPVQNSGMDFPQPGEKNAPAPRASQSRGRASVPGMSASGGGRDQVASLLG